MYKNSSSNTRKSQKTATPEKKSAGRLRVFYLLMLVLTVSSLLLRLGASKVTSTAKPGAGTAARVLVFHHKEGSLCQDLEVTAVWNAVLSDCTQGAEKQYALTSAERTQLQTWIETYRAVTYDPGGSAALQLYLNGRGRREATETETLQLVDFAETLASKVASQS